MSDTMNMQTTIIEGTATERTLSVVAAEINVIKRQTAEIINRSVFEIGKRLCEAKALIGHGNWGAWLQENVDYSETTARSMMRIYQEMGGEQVDLITGEAPIDVFETLNMSQMVALFPLRPEERIEFVKENDVADKSVRQIEELVRKVKDAEAQAAQEREDKNQKIMEARAAELEAGKLQRALDEKQAEIDRLSSEIEALKAAPVQPSISFDEVQGGEAAHDDDDVLGEVDNNPYVAKIDALEAKLKEAQAALHEAQAASKAAAKKAKEDLAKEKDRATAEAKAVFEAKLNPVAQAVNGALRQIGIQIEDIGMSLDEMRKSDEGAADELMLKAKAAIKAMVDAIEW